MPYHEDPGGGQWDGEWQLPWHYYYICKVCGALTDNIVGVQVNSQIKSDGVKLRIHLFLEPLCHSCHGWWIDLEVGGMGLPIGDGS